MRKFLSLSVGVTCGAALFALGACSPASAPQVDQANADLKAAGESTQAAAEHLGDAAKQDSKSAAESAQAAADRAQAATGSAIEKAGADMKADAKK